MHTLQDCHSHTLRSADVRTVFTVLNYIDAVAGRLDEARDGMAHSDTLDDCERAELAPVVARAAATSLALARAAVALARTGDGTLLAKGFAPAPPARPTPRLANGCTTSPTASRRHSLRAPRSAARKATRTAERPISPSRAKSSRSRTSRRY